MLLHWLKETTPSNSNWQQTELAVTGGGRLDSEWTELGNCWVFMLNGSLFPASLQLTLVLADAIMWPMEDQKETSNSRISFVWILMFQLICLQLELGNTFTFFTASLSHPFILNKWNLPRWYPGTLEEDSHKGDMSEHRIWIPRSHEKDRHG